MHVQHELLVNRPPVCEGIQDDLVAFLEVLYLEERAGVARKACHAPVLKDVPGVAIGNRGILDGSRMVGKTHPIVYKRDGKSVSIDDVPVGPFGDDVLIGRLDNASVINHATPHK